MADPKDQKKEKQVTLVLLKPTTLAGVDYKAKKEITVLESEAKRLVQRGIAKAKAEK